MSSSNSPEHLTRSDIEPIARSPATPPPASTPSLPSPGSLSRLGLSPFTHHRQHPTTPPQQQRHRGSTASSGASSSTDDLTRDSRDVLVQRLADLAERLTDGHFPDQSISELHCRVDELEDTVRLSESPRLTPTKKKTAAKQHHSNGDDGSTTDETGGGEGRLRTRSLDVDLWARSPPRPTPLRRSGFSDPSHLLARGSPFARNKKHLDPSAFPRSLFPDTATGETHLLLPALVRMDDGVSGPVAAAGQRHITAEDAARIAREAEQLNFHLATLTTRLQARQEESEHIHSLLIQRAERAAQRIIVLEAQVADLTLSLKDTNSELSNLRIALKAIELQCPPPQNLDEDLRQSIQNWKADWKRIRQARAARSSHEASFSSMPATPGTPW